MEEDLHDRGILLYVVHLKQCMSCCLMQRSINVMTLLRNGSLLNLDTLSMFFYRARVDLMGVSLQGFS